MKFYKADIAEYLKDGYFTDNCSTCEDAYVSFRFITDETSGDVDIYQLNEEKYKSKIIEESLIKTLSLTSYDEGLYLETAVADSVGLYRYKLDLPDTPYYSDPFRVIESPTREEFNSVDSGFLKFYDEDFLEYIKDGYYENNTPVNMDMYLSEVYFDSSLTISSIASEIRQIDTVKLSQKTISDFKLQDLTLTNTGSIVYLADPVFVNNGLYRIKSTVTPTVGDAETFYSELFCIGEYQEWILEFNIWNDLGVWKDNKIWND